MINCLLEDNIVFLIDFIKRFMLPEQRDKYEEMGFIYERKDKADFMKELRTVKARYIVTNNIKDFKESAKQ